MGGKSAGQQPNSGGGSTWNGSGTMMPPPGGPPQSQAPYQPGERGMYEGWQSRERNVAAQPPAWANQPTYDETDPDMGAPAPGPERMESQSFDQYRAGQSGGFAPSWMKQNTGGNGGNMPQWGGGKFKAPPPIYTQQQQLPETPAAADGYGQGEPPQVAEQQPWHGELGNKMAQARSNALRRA